MNIGRCVSTEEFGTNGRLDASHKVYFLNQKEEIQLMNWRI